MPTCSRPSRETPKGREGGSNSGRIGSGQLPVKWYVGLGLGLGRKRKWPKAEAFGFIASELPEEEISKGAYI